MPASRHRQPYEPARMDTIAWKIVEELQQDARLSWAELGRRVGLTTPAVAERVQRLEKLGVIRGFHADINLERLGMPILIFVRLSMTGPENAGARLSTGRENLGGGLRVPPCHRIRLLHCQSAGGFGGAS